MTWARLSTRSPAEWAERVGADRLGVRDAVQRPVVGQLRDRVQAREQAVGLGAVARVCARGKGGVRLAAVGGCAGGLAVDDVRGDGQNRGCRLGIAVGVAALDLLKEALEQPDRNFVGAVVVIAVFREIALGLIADDKAVSSRTVLTLAYLIALRLSTTWLKPAMPVAKVRRTSVSMRAISAAS